MFSGSARANATTIMPTTTNDDRTIAARLISGDFLHNGTDQDRLRMDIGGVMHLRPYVAHCVQRHQEPEPTLGPNDPYEPPRNTSGEPPVSWSLRSTTSPTTPPKCAREHANNSQNLPASRTKRTQGRNNPVQGNPTLRPHTLRNDLTSNHAIHRARLVAI